MKEQLFFIKMNRLWNEKVNGLVQDIEGKVGRNF